MPRKNSAKTSIGKDAFNTIETLVGKKSAIALDKHFNSLHAIGRASDTLLSNKAPTLSQGDITKLRNAFKLSRLLIEEKLPTPFLWKRSSDIRNLFRESFRLANKEHRKVFLLNKNLELIEIADIEKADNKTSEKNEIKAIFEAAMIHDADRFELVSNHLTTSPRPRSEKAFTRKVIRMGKLIGIDLCDHTIIGKNMQNKENYISMIYDGYVW